MLFLSLLLFLNIYFILLYNKLGAYASFSNFGPTVLSFFITDSLLVLCGKKKKLLKWYFFYFLFINNHKSDDNLDQEHSVGLVMVVSLNSEMLLFSGRTRKNHSNCQLFVTMLPSPSPLLIFNHSNYSPKFKNRFCSLNFILFFVFTIFSLFKL